MRASGRLLLACLAAVVAQDAARADALERWRFADGDNGSATASLPASSKLSTAGGALAYSPVLTISCRNDADPQWSGWLQLRDRVSASSSINVLVAFDGDAGNSESWLVDGGGKVLLRRGADVVARLASAGKLRLSWRLGLLAGRGEALFDLAGSSDAVAKLAESCGTAAPS